MEDIESLEVFLPQVWHIEELCYLAGFLDGEGTFTVYRLPHANQLNTTNYVAVLTAASTDETMALWLKQTFGGRLHRLAKEGNRQDAYQWRIQDKAELINLLPQLFPYLRLKVIHARLLMKYCVEFQGSRRGHPVSQEDHELRAAYCLMFSNLNATGKGAGETKARVIELVVNSGISLP